MAAGCWKKRGGERRERENEMKKMIEGKKERRKRCGPAVREKEKKGSGPG